MPEQTISSSVIQGGAVEHELAELHRLMAIAAHDFRNPLASIRGFAEMLSSEMLAPLTTEQKEFVSIILEVSQNTLRQLNDLDDVFKLQSGKLSLKREQGDFGALVAQRIQQTAPALEFTPPSELPPFFFDAARLSRVVDEWLAEAIAASPKGASLKVSLALQEDRLTLRLSGAANRASQTREGLGMAIARRLLVIHGGTLLDTDDGREISFPLLGEG
ncbi:MAG TPA: hypothetical protein DD435_07900 [Cyanobacteria bacterium UBA8530]|nr:hypothetical protein [Cyanobacteria bacterium UBA8530]